MFFTENVNVQTSLILIFLRFNLGRLKLRDYTLMSKTIDQIKTTSHNFHNMTPNEQRYVKFKCVKNRSAKILKKEIKVFVYALRKVSDVIRNLSHKNDRIARSFVKDTPVNYVSCFMILSL